MSDKVTTLRCLTTLDIPADKVLEGAVGKLSDVVVAGRDEHGNAYVASSYGSVADTAWMLEHAKKFLLEM